MKISCSRMRCKATAAHVEERCRQIRNVAPESVHDARRAWAQRSLMVWRNEARGMLRITVELPIEDGELIARAIDCAVAACEVTTGIEPDADRSSRKATAWRASKPMRWSRSPRRIWTVRRRYAMHQRPITTKSSCTSMKNPSAEGLAEPICRSTQLSGSAAMAISSQSSRPSAARRSTSSASSSTSRRRWSVRSTRRDRSYSFPASGARALLDAHHLDIGPKVATRASIPDAALHASSPLPARGRLPHQREANGELR